ncbi:MAG: hypothetical protein NXI15_05515 [Gammaproteobacteria bacterium]|nr:hypothetical protein [Gammaproteobacteria bacterium]
MRWVYRLTFTNGRRVTFPSAERIDDCLAHFQARFGADAVAGVTERFGDGEPVEHYPHDDRKARIMSAIDTFHRSVRR